MVAYWGKESFEFPGFYRLTCKYLLVSTCWLDQCFTFVGQIDHLPLQSIDDHSLYYDNDNQNQSNTAYHRCSYRWHSSGCRFTAVSLYRCSVYHHTCWRILSVTDPLCGRLCVILKRVILLLINMMSHLPLRQLLLRIIMKLLQGWNVTMGCMINWR